MQAHDIPLKGKGAHVPLLHILSKTVFKKTQQQSITQNHLQLLARPNHSEKVCLDQRAEKREKYLQIKLERYWALERYGPDETDCEIHLSPIGKLGFLWSSHCEQLFLIISCSALVETIHISTCMSNDTECVTICQYCWIVRPCGSTRLNTTNNIWEGDDVLTVINACLYTLACMLSITHNSVAFLDI